MNHFLDLVMGMIITCLIFSSQERAESKSALAIGLVRLISTETGASFEKMREYKDRSARSKI